MSDTIKATRNKMLSLIVGIPLALGVSSCSNTPEASQNPDATQKIATSLQTIGLIPGDIDVSQWNDSILESETPEEISKKEMIALSLAVLVRLVLARNAIKICLHKTLQYGTTKPTLPHVSGMTRTNPSCNNTGFIRLKKYLHNSILMNTLTRTSSPLSQTGVEKNIWHTLRNTALGITLACGLSGCGENPEKASVKELQHLL